MARHAAQEGDAIHPRTADGHPMLVQRTTQEEPQSRIEATSEPQREGGGGPSRTVFRIAPQGPLCALTVEHCELTFPVVEGQGIGDGWVRWAAGIKTRLKIGEGLFTDEKADAA